MDVKLIGNVGNVSQLSVNQADQRFQKYSWWLILLLLFLRVILFGWFPNFAKGEYTWLDPVYQIGTYAFAALFLFINRHRLAIYHFDKLAVLLFVIFKPIQTLILPLMDNRAIKLMAFPHITALLIWVIAIVLLIAMWPCLVKLPKIRASNWIWILLGGISGILLVVAVSFLLIPWSNIQHITPIYDITLLLAFPYQIGYAGIDEEPLFRGFLWGQLRHSGWRDTSILVFQAALFMLAHGRLLTSFTNLPFALTIFVGGIVFGLLAIRSRSTATSMMAHAFYNASGIFGYYLISSLFG